MSKREAAFIFQQAGLSIRYRPSQPPQTSAFVETCIIKILMFAIPRNGSLPLRPGELVQGKYLVIFSEMIKTSIGGGCVSALLVYRHLRGLEKSALVGTAL